MSAVAFGFLCVAAALALQLARTKPAHRPVVALLGGAVLAELVRHELRALVLQPARQALGAGVPYSGAVRIAFHVEQALFTAWPAGIAACAVVVLARRSPLPVAGAWALVVAGLAVGYPRVRLAPLGSTYLAIEALSLVVVALAGVAWWRRRDPPTISEGSILVAAFVEVGVLFAYREPFGPGWDVALGAYVVGFGALAFLHAGELWLSEPRSR